MCPTMHSPPRYARSMVRFTVLASGSKGNATVVTGGRTRILVDCGLSCRELFRRMRQVGEEPETLDAILITHEHSDHVGGVAVTARKLGIPVYFTEGTHRAWMRWLSPAEPEEPAKAKEPTWLPAVEYFAAGEAFEIGDIRISPFTTPHDAADPVGFVFAAEGVRMGFVTDLGYISPNVKAQLKDLDLLLLESNHDLEMLRDGPYPWSVKQRVMSRVGHLSNEAAASFLEEDYDGQAAYVILAHLSESNNLPELARVTAERALNGRASLLANMLLLATQHEPLSSITFR